MSCSNEEILNKLSDYVEERQRRFVAQSEASRAKSAELLARDALVCEELSESVKLDQVSPTLILANIKHADYGDRVFQFGLIFEDYPWKGPSVFSLDRDVVRSKHFRGSIVMDTEEWDCWSPAAKVKQVILNLQCMLGDLA